MQELPLISVIVPVYNVEKYLDCCVRSILAQSYGNLELILVDDGSPDGSGAICDAWADKDARVRVIHQANAGGGAARNTGLDAANGSLISFIDSDDYISPEMFAHLYAMLAQGADIAECAFLETREDGALFPEGKETITFYTPEEAMVCNLRDTWFRQLLWNKLYRRETIGALRFPVGTKIDDEFFTYQALGNARRLARSEKICYAYRQQPGSVMHEGYSLRRLEGLHAKKERLAYLETRMPALAPEGALILFFSCMHALQMCQLHLGKEDQKKAWAEIKPLLPDLTPGKRYSWKENVWLVLSRISFPMTCRIRNFLFERT